MAILGASVAAPAARGETSLLQPDSRIRLSISTPELIRVMAGGPLTPKELRRDRFVGTFLGRRENDVVIRVHESQAELAVPIRSVTRLETSLGKHGNAGRGALIGLGAGLVGGIAAGIIVCSSGDCDTDGDAFLTLSPGFVTGVLALGGAIAGTGVGALTGAMIRSERWQPISLRDAP